MANKNGQKGGGVVAFSDGRIGRSPMPTIPPEEQVVFCFSASQRKAKKFLCVLCGSSEAGGEFMSKG
jgi:hypothetical protein